MSFRSDDWILVGDRNICEHTRMQLDIFQNLNVTIKGALFCDSDQHVNHDACTQVPAFPAFCNVNTNICVSGLREDLQSLDDLQKISDEKKHSQ